MNTDTAFHRVTAVIQHEEPDYCPAFPVLLLQGAAELGLALEEYFSSGQNLAEGQMRLLRKYRHDCVYGIPHIVEDITAFGASLFYFRNGPPSPAEMVIGSYEAVSDMTAPDPTSSPVLYETLGAIDGLARQVKGEVPILGACIAPFSLPSMLMGTEAWMDLLLFQEPEVRDPIMDHLLTVCTEFCAAWANAQLAAGADVVILADGMSSAAVINRRQFVEFALPVLKRIVPLIRGPVIHEGVGDLHPMLDLLVDTGVVGAILSYRDDLTQAKQLVGDKLTLIGNLNNIEMCRWSVQDMQQSAEAALSAAAHGGGFILGTQGPEIPLGVSEEVIHALVDTAHGWRYSS